MNRLRIFQRFIAAGFLFLCSVLVYHQLIQFNRYRQLSQANRIRILPQPAARGRILDRRGNILADNTLSYNLLVMPEQNGFPIEPAERIAGILSVSEQELKSRYKKAYKAPFVPVLLSKDIPLSQAIAIGQLKYDFPQLIIQAQPKRVYPLGNIASHLLGYLSRIDARRLQQLEKYGYKMQDLVGCSGIEEVYDYILRPKQGGMQVEVDYRGRLSRVLGLKAAQAGTDIELTIDLRIQKIVHNSLKGHTGCAIILNPDNGEVLALASFPDFNPQLFQDGPFSLLNSLLNDPDAPLLNRAINGLYPPGSVFKIILAAAGLEKKKITPDTTFFCSGKMQIGNRDFACWGRHEQEDIVDALAHSCNVFFYNLGLRLGPQLINEYALKFGLSQASGIELNGESTGFLPYSLWQRIKRRRRWFAGDTANLSIGQGEILVTPLQIARIMAALANRGKLIKPRLLQAIRQEGQAVNPAPAQAANLAVSQQTLGIIRQGLLGAVRDTGGTANILAEAGVSIAGKTGSAQVSSGQAHGWFVGYFPAAKPKFVICVFLEHCGSGYRSCQLAKIIIKRMLAEGLI